MSVSGIRMMAVSVTPQALADAQHIDTTFGALLIGNFVGLVMYGTAVNQTFRYFQMYPSDGWRLRALVLVMIALDTLHALGSSHMCYHYLVSNYLNPAALSIGTWSPKVVGIVMGIIIFVAQVFYIRRIYLLNRNYRRLVIVMVLLILGELGAAIAASVEGSTNFASMPRSQLIRIESTALITVLVTDIFLAVTLVVILHRNRTGFSRTDSLLNLVTAYTVNTCVLTSFINLLALTMLIASGSAENMVYFAILIPATRSYTIAVLAVLNSRKTFVEAGRTGAQYSDGEELGTFGLSMHTASCHSTDGLVTRQTPLAGRPSLRYPNFSSSRSLVPYPPPSQTPTTAGLPSR